MQYKVKTTLSSQQVMEQAIAYFGAQGKGLALTSQHKRAMRLQGNDGYVAVMVKSESPTLIEIDTRTWEKAVQQFIAQLPQQRRPWWTRWWHRKSA
jgi:hypothetical protein